MLVLLGRRGWRCGCGRRKPHSSRLHCDTKVRIGVPIAGFLPLQHLRNESLPSVPSLTVQVTCSLKHLLEECWRTSCLVNVNVRFGPPQDAAYVRRLEHAAFREDD